MPEPLVLRLPDAAALAPTGVVRLLGEAMPAGVARGLSARFELSSRERDFARSLLHHKTNLRLWRCHQGAACGDFVVVDMAPGSADQRRACVVELKSGGDLRVGGNDHQLRNAEAAVAEVAATGALCATCPVVRVTGDKAEVLAWLSA